MQPFALRVPFTPSEGRVRVCYFASDGSDRHQRRVRKRYNYEARCVYWETRPPRPADDGSRGGRGVQERMSLRYRAVLFDLDGTLVDSYTALAEAVNYARREHGLDELSAGRIRDFVGDG